MQEDNLQKIISRRPSEGDLLRECMQRQTASGYQGQHAFGAERPGADLSCLRQYTRTGPREVRTRESRMPSGRLRVPRGIGCYASKYYEIQKEPKGSEWDPKSNQRATKMHQKINFRKR